MNNKYDVVVIGDGQGGLALGHQVAQQGGYPTRDEVLAYLQDYAGQRQGD